MPTQEDKQEELALLERELALKNYNRELLFSTITYAPDIERYLRETETLQQRIEDKRRELSA